MSRFFAPTVESIGPGPSVQAPGDGREGLYIGVLNSVPSGGRCLVTIQSLDPTIHHVTFCPTGASGSVGQAVLVGFDDNKDLWLVVNLGRNTP